MLYFDSRPDRRGLRPALHPVAARWMDPKNVLVLVDNGPKPSPD